MKHIIIFCTLVGGFLAAFAQNPSAKVSGEVLGPDVTGTLLPLEKASVYWLTTKQGVLTDESGRFSLALPQQASDKLLVIEYAGYAADTLAVGSPSNPLRVVLKVLTADEVLISEKQKGSRVSTLNPIRTEIMSEFELTKAACCNLSESFENSATVDVAFSDAISGAKRIRVLGLDGIYTQILTETYPSIRGLATAFGLNHVPGPWMSGIQVSKGTASVQNGYESMTGQINVEYHKPQNTNRLYINAYMNQFGRMESSAVLSHRFSQKLSTALFIHGNRFQNTIDRNQDSFLEMPLVDQFIVFNRWRWHTGRGLRGQFGAKYLEENRLGGQVNFDPKTDRSTSNAYGIEIKTKRWEAYNKMGYAFVGKKGKSIGSVLNVSQHQQEAFYGLDRYTGQQRSLYGKVLYSTILDNTNHSLTSGASFRYDDFQEQYNDSSFQRRERVPGLFTEYTYNRLNRLIIVGGLRTDFHNLYGNIYTVRSHLKYNFTEKTILRASAGNGFRVANVFAEYLPALMSGRKVTVSEALVPERAWNYGFNLTQYFKLFGKEGNISFDAYRTDFMQQVVVDREAAGQLIFSNLEGASYSNAIQIEGFYELLPQVELRAAWKWTDVKTTIQGQRLAIALVPRQRALLTVGYLSTNEKWQFDTNLQWIGKSRLPATGDYPVDYQLGDYSPSFVQLGAQASHTMGPLQVYIGGENLTGFRQENPIMAADKPFGQYFDASLIWGPVLGRRVYAGIRFKIKGNQPEGF